jgi:hypothetical protein
MIHVRGQPVERAEWDWEWDFMIVFAALIQMSQYFPAAPWRIF